MVDQDVLAALVEAEQIGFVAKRALMDATEDSATTEGEVADGTGGPNDEQQPETDEMGVGGAPGHAAEDQGADGEMRGEILEAGEGSRRNLESRLPLEEPAGFKSRLVLLSSFIQHACHLSCSLAVILSICLLI